MRRYWLNNIDGLKDSIEIEGDEFHHIFHVCRREVGHKFEVLFGDGNAYLVEAEKVGKKKALVRILEKREVPKIKPPYIHLAISLPKVSTFESVLEKAVELGVSTVHPFLSDYSHFKSKAHKALQKEKRWQKIITGATQQSGRAQKMELSPIISFKELTENFNQNSQRVGLLAYEGESPLAWKKAVQQIAKDSLSEIWVFVGSEGGFSDKEITICHQTGLKTMTMGDQVLRVETACVALISSLKYEMEL